MEQVLAILMFSLRTVPQRLGSVLTAVFGITGVVMVMVGVLSIGEGYKKTMKASGDPAVAMVLRSGADTEMMSGLSRQDTRIIKDHPAIKQVDGTPAAAAELFVIINLPKRGTGTDANVPLRGIQPQSYAVREKFEMLEGRFFEPGRNELIVGRGAVGQFEVELGKEIQVGANRWKIVGVFAEGGGVAESEMWTDAGVLQSAYRRGDTFQSMYIKLEDAARFTAFKSELIRDPRLRVKVMRQTDYYAEQSRTITTLVTALGAIIGTLMAAGAVFSAVNTMVTAVAARGREIATLRAIGFHRVPIVLSILVESTLLALAGGLIGGFIAYLLFDGFRTATMNFQSFSQVTFAFEVDAGLLAMGVFYSTVIGLIGGLLPAVQAVRSPVADALRSE
nr:ABC transporter permease [Acanthopleuribacter pedis]